MKIDIKVIPGAKKNLVKQEQDMWQGDSWKVYVSAPAVDGKANKALIEVLAKHFQVPKSQIEIIKGLKSRRKTINISGKLAL
jgi:uncharacterized protein (TIGR00251 family)